MANAIRIAADFVHLLPRDRLSPETTEGDEGFVHPYVVNASVERTSVRLLIRDFHTAGLKEKRRWSNVSRGRRRPVTRGARGHRHPGVVSK
jgi:tripeptide aminopeptidase